MKLTTEQFNILAHVVVDPQAWADHLEQSKVDNKALDAKVDRHRASYNAEKNKSGYKNRAARQADADAVFEQQGLDAEAARVTKQEQYDADLQTKVDAAVAKALKK